MCEEHGCPINNSDDIVERINLYQSIIMNKKILDTTTIETLITIPQQPSTYLSDLESLAEFSFMRGGSFVNNELLPGEELIDVLEILKELVEVDVGEERSL
jgi:hypothetical protein